MSETAVVVLTFVVSYGLIAGYAAYLLWRRQKTGS